ncbi:MAG: hypothetical protein HY658_12290 [Actinobacteria bacterium]|nr:hypothetical protein [Actinomycetota bacterium]
MPPPPSEQPTYSHSGQRYLLGYTSDQYAIWDRQQPGEPARRFPKTEQGWSEAWAAYQSFEAGAAVPPPPSAAAPMPQPAAAARPPIQITGRLVAQVLRVVAWVVLGLFPITGIALMTSTGAGFATVMTGLANMALGVALWGICLALSKVADREG